MDCGLGIFRFAAELEVSLLVDDIADGQADDWMIVDEEDACFLGLRGGGRFFRGRFSHKEYPAGCAG